MNKLNKDSILFITKELYIGKHDYIVSVVSKVKNEVNKIIGKEVLHENERFIIRDINVIETIFDNYILVIITLEQLNKYTELTYSLPVYLTRVIKMIEEIIELEEIQMSKESDRIEANLECGRKIKEPQKVVVPKFVADPNITVEQEKLYTVEIEGVGSSKLFKNIRTNEYLFHSGFHRGKKLEWWYTDKLTEQEIKKACEHLWKFAKPVEDK